MGPCDLAFSGPPHGSHGVSTGALHLHWTNKPAFAPLLALFEGLLSLLLLPPDIHTWQAQGRENPIDGDPCPKFPACHTIHESD